MKNGYTPRQAEQIIKRAVLSAPITADEDDIDAYLFGCDNPKSYFSKFGSEAELISDFQDFLKG